jgi:uncharacterized protein
MNEDQRQRMVIWDKVNGLGAEVVSVTLEADRLAAQILGIGWDPVRYRLDGVLETGAAWVTTSLAVSVNGDGWKRTLDLRRSPAGTWTIATTMDGRVDLGPPGGDPSALASVLDCDLGRSPMTNTMPVLRHDLLRQDGSVDFVMAWVSVPDLAVRASAQRYTTLGHDRRGRRRIQYRSLDSEVAHELLFDADGLVVDYPQLARAVP